MISPEELSQDKQRLIPQAWIEFFRFAIVGLANTIIDFGLFMLLYTKLGVDPILANIFAFLLAVTNSYFLNSRWTFDSSNHSISKSGFIRFIMISSAGLVISITTIMVLDGYMAVEMAKLLATGLTLIWNFTTSKLFIFNGVS